VTPGEMHLSDLSPKSDPKAGSPLSSSIPMSDYQSGFSHSESACKFLVGPLVGLVIGLSVAWFTAWQSKGVTHAELEHYVADYSPYIKDRDMLALHNSEQDQKIGELKGGDEHINARVSAIELKLSGDERDISDCRSKIDLAGSYLEELKKAKR
jgi:hypothetical protein